MWWLDKKKDGQFFIVRLCTSLSKGFECLFGGAAYGAFPVIGQVFKFNTFGNLPFSIPFVGIVNVAAVGHLTLIHIFWFCHCRFLCDKVPCFGDIAPVSKFSTYCIGCKTASMVSTVSSVELNALRDTFAGYILPIFCSFSFIPSSYPVAQNFVKSVLSAWFSKTVAFFPSN